MLWDGLIAALIFGLAITGWRVGLINSWRTPFAILLATIVTQQFYVDFATFIVQQLRVTPTEAIASGYIMLWCAAEIVAELLMTLTLTFGKKTKPPFFDRLFGAGLGMCKGVLVVILPAIALTGPINVPEAPPDKA